MSMFDSCTLKTSLPVLFLLLLVAQIDLASAFAWPVPLLSLLHLTPVTGDTVRGVCAGVGCSIDALVFFQLMRIFARRALAHNSSRQQ